MNTALAFVLAFGLATSQAAPLSATLTKGLGYEGAIMTAESLRRSEPGGRRAFTEYWTPAETDVREAETRLVEYLGSSDAAPVLRGARVRSELAQYRRQYWGVVRDGQRELLISFFHANTPAVARELWKTTVFAVAGGGDNYFRVSFGVDSKRFSRLQINAPE